MKVFSLNSKVVNGIPETTNLTVSMSVDESRLIVKLCENMKPSQNEVVESVRTGIVESLKNY